MLDLALDNALADHRTYGNVEMQHRMFARLRREDPIHWTEPPGYRPFWTVTKYADIIEIERHHTFVDAVTLGPFLDDLHHCGPVRAPCWKRIEARIVG